MMGGAAEGWWFVCNQRTSKYWKKQCVFVASDLWSFTERLVGSGWLAAAVLDSVVIMGMMENML